MPTIDLEDAATMATTRRRVLKTGAKLAYAAPLVAASFKLGAQGASAQAASPLPAVCAPPEGDCGAYGPCGEGGAFGCVCGTSLAGARFCFETDFCSNRPICDSTTPCPDGQTCVQTGGCCGNNTCYPACSNQTAFGIVAVGSGPRPGL